MPSSQYFVTTHYFDIENKLLYVNTFIAVINMNSPSSHLDIQWNIYNMDSFPCPFCQEEYYSINLVRFIVLGDDVLACLIP